MKHNCLSIAVAVVLTAILPSCKQGFSRARLEAPLRETVLATAEADLGRAPVTVTAFRCERSCGGPHDFYSEGDYWWPNPDDPDGPYIRRDGESNPENFSEHRRAMFELSRMTGNFASAWILTGDGRYAAAAERHLRAWFMDPETRMNPSLLYAQAIKGVVTGRGIGIIDTIHLIEVAQAALRLGEAGAISGECLEACRSWFRDYLEWMDTHPYGVKERNAQNNHGTWWYAQAASFALLTGDEAMLERCRVAYKERFLPESMAPDGSFPLELSRTKPYFYSIFQLKALALLCHILSTPDDDLWAYTTPDGKCMRKGLDYMLPYIIDKESWPHQRDVSHWEGWPVAVPAYVLAWAHWGDERYYKAWAPFDHFSPDEEIQRATAVRNPLIWLPLSSLELWTPVSNAVQDRMQEPKLADVRLEGAVGKKMDTFFQQRIFSDFARNTVMQEAEEAFKNRVDDVVRAPIGYWQGEFWGKLMIGASRVAQYKNDPGFTRYVREEAHRLLCYQDADGYLGTYADKAYVTAPDLQKARETMGWDCDWCWNLWCRKYTMWGLLMAYEATGDRSLVTAAARSMDQEISMLDSLGLKLWQTGTPHFAGLPSCSVLKPLLQLYRYTGYRRYLSLAREIVAHWDSPDGACPNLIANAFSGRPVSDWYPNPFSWAKAYEMMSCLDGLLEYYRVTGEERPLEAVERIQELLWTHERNPLQSVGYNDQFGGGATHINGISEPCDAIHWMRLNHDLFLITGNPHYVDVMELTFFNAFLAGVFRDGKWGARGVRTEGRHLVAHNQALMEHSHCCVNNIPRGFMDVAQTLVSRDAEGTVYINWYSDSRSAIDGVRVQVTGNYPVGGEVAVQVETSAPLKVRLRVPAWAAGGRMTVDGVAAQPGWFETSIGGPHCFRIHFDLTPIVANSDKPAVERYAADDKRITKWNSNGNDADITALTRSTPMAQVFRGPLLLAKCKRVGDSEAEIFTKKSINRQGYTCTADALDNENVWGAWLLTLSNGKERFRVKASDYASSGDEELPRGANAFSVFF
ncbi:MAG: alginate lyase family protein [Bacteroidales bacterium]|nr:alginate lyase family protein [Bacteroidales bacterium]